MKKITSLFMAVAIVALITSCQKDNDGIYKPGKKIAKITITEGEGDVSVQTWNWDGGLLKSVDGTYNGQSDGSILYEYDGKKLTKASYSTGDAYYAISYEGKKISKIAAFNDGRQEMSMELGYDGKQIKEIKVSYEEGDVAKRSISYRAMCTVLPREAVDLICKQLTSGAKGAQTFTVTLTWDGKNLASVVIPYMGVDVNMNYTYDDKSNPYHDFVGLALSYDGFATYCSVNNPTECSIPIMQEKLTYTYEYTGKYPSKVTASDNTVQVIEYL